MQALNRKKQSGQVWKSAPMNLSFCLTLCILRLVSAVLVRNNISSMPTWNSRYLAKSNLTDGAQLMIWSLDTNQSINSHGDYSAPGDWIQLDVLKDSHPDEEVYLRLYLDERRFLRHCVLKPKDTGGPVPPETNYFLPESTKISVHEINLFSVESILSSCRLLQMRTSVGRSLRREKRWFWSLVHLLTGALFNSLRMPNTNHCGPNGGAGSDEPLGYAMKTDQCCRDHDRCAYNIHSDETKYGIKNTMKATMSFCHCDDHFRRCLLKAGEFTAYAVGILFFNVYRPDCFYFPDGDMKRARTRSVNSFF
uniref:Phospholipase A2 n=1 Tax=Clonorchis sinensis TaxID=79923 RepID=C9V3K9_CLOSI|nr:phospholipase A2 precursor [Clonorchis sinensis]